VTTPGIGDHITEGPGLHHLDVWWRYQWRWGTETCTCRWVAFSRHLCYL